MGADASLYDLAKIFKQCSPCDLGFIALFWHQKILAVLHHSELCRVRQDQFGVLDGQSAQRRKRIVDLFYQLSGQLVGKQRYPCCQYI